MVGLTIALRFGSTFDVFTSPARRGTGDEVEMIRWADGTTRRHAGPAAVVGTDVYDCDATRAELLAGLYRGLGFERRFQTFGYRRRQPRRR